MDVIKMIITQLLVSHLRDASREDKIASCVALFEHLLTELLGEAVEITHDAALSVEPVQGQPQEVGEDGCTAKVQPYKDQAVN